MARSFTHPVSGVAAGAAVQRLHGVADSGTVPHDLRRDRLGIEQLSQSVFLSSTKINSRVRGGATLRAASAKKIGDPGVPSSYRPSPA
jgi:hypothetical protein